MVPLILFTGQSVYAADQNETTTSEVIVVLGGSLSEEQKQETRELLNITEGDEYVEVVVTGEDFEKYVGGDPTSRMFSSAKISSLDKGEGIKVVQVTPENITKVTDSMYANALITAGVEDVKVEVASPVQVTGHSALTGIFKAYEASGEELDTARLDVADQELNLATSLVENAGLTDAQVNELLTEIKQAIAEQNPVSREEVEQIVAEQLQKLDLTIPEEYKQLLIDLFDKIRQLDIDFSKVQEQLESLASDIQKKLEDAGIDEGFFQQVGNFFKELIQSIVNFFKGLF